MAVAPEYELIGTVLRVEGVTECVSDCRKDSLGFEGQINNVMHLTCRQKSFNICSSE